MKRLFFVFSVFALMLVAACSESKNPLWGLWTLQSSTPGAKTEIMFNDDYSGFVFVADTVSHETTWQQDSLLRVNYFESGTGKKSLGVNKVYSVTVEGDVLTLKEIATGETSKFKRFVE